MRPVNLIPPEERRGGAAPLRTGPLPYVLIGGLVLLLIGVVALVLAGNEVSDRESEVATLEVEDARAAAEARKLAAYTEFREMSEARVETVSELADSRFDWERVMRELALILPDDVWLVGLTATATPGVQVEGGGSGGDTSGMRSAAPGPALELGGCAKGQEAVAAFVTALEDIDGVTRVGVQSSELPSANKGSEGGSDSGGDECRTREWIAKFAIVVAFDAAPVVEAATDEGAAPVATSKPVEAGSEEESESEEGAEGEAE